MPPQVTHDVAVTRLFDATVEQVWAAWTEDAEVKEWWGPKPFTCPEARMDVREGGASVVCMRSPDGLEIWMRWAYSNVIRYERMEYTQNMCDRNGNLIEPTSIGMPAEFPRDVATVVTLAPRDGKTALTITERTTTSQVLMDGSQQGLEMCIDQMGATFA